MKNLCGKTRPIDNPYEIWVNDKGWEWRVLKKYQSPEGEKKNPYARWFIAVKSPFTYGEWEYGDTYISDIVHGSRQTLGKPDLDIAMREVVDIPVRGA